MQYEDARRTVLAACIVHNVVNLHNKSGQREYLCKLLHWNCFRYRRAGSFSSFRPIAVSADGENRSLKATLRRSLPRCEQQASTSLDRIPPGSRKYGKCCTVAASTVEVLC